MSEPRNLTAQDLMTLRDAAEALDDIDVAHELNAVGDVMADRLKLQIDTPQNDDGAVAIPPCDGGQVP